MSRPEVWLRGPLDGYPALLQPVAHALLQSREDLERLATAVSPDQLWQKPGGAASIGFHIVHITGSIDRLTTYARGERLDEPQMRALRAEDTAAASARSIDAITADALAMIDRALRQVRATPDDTLLDTRTVGRAALPSTVIGLLVHVAEHTTRHVGQALTTAAILRGEKGSGHAPR